MTKKWGISIKKESESLIFTGLKIPRDYMYGLVANDLEEKVISESDIYITNRDQETMKRVEFADWYQVEILSGVDIPIFKNK